MISDTVNPYEDTLELMVIIMLCEYSSSVLDASNVSSLQLF